MKTEVVNVVCIEKDDCLLGNIRSFVFNEENKEEVIKKCCEYFQKKLNSLIPKLNYTMEDCERINFIFEDNEEYKIMMVFSVMEDNEETDLSNF